MSETPKIGERSDCPAEVQVGDCAWFCCTLDANHEGEHCAHVSDDVIAHRWPQAPAPSSGTGRGEDDGK